MGKELGVPDSDRRFDGQRARSPNGEELRKRSWKGEGSRKGLKKRTLLGE